jgi:hypothetical protein
LGEIIYCVEYTKEIITTKRIMDSIEEFRGCFSIYETRWDSVKKFALSIGQL